ncbi:winged helix-turn-helix domain-containing protein [uncultured Amnibacterium sp.]|uniref:winged helix-turn-helix domain-containing protein n=1 Tax=uncultured Amnibacterium sp. TaxID=1631851 RepID=UPI0035CC2B71
MTEQLSIAAARRIALAAQGFCRPHPAAVGTRQLNGMIERLHLLQIDSVNVFERSHYLPAFARLGAYDRSLLDALTLRTHSRTTEAWSAESRSARPRSAQPRSAQPRYTEYWAHQAAFIKVADLPLFGFRTDFYRRKYAEWMAEHEKTVRLLRDELTDRGPLTASEVRGQPNERTGPWWGWSDVKTALELLWLQGDLVTAGRRRFERRYGLPQHVLGDSAAAGLGSGLGGGVGTSTDTAVPQADAIRELMRRGAAALGIGTLSDFADYYRLKVTDARAAVLELQDAGELIPVTVRGWSRGGRPLPVWRHAAARVPRRIEAAALLSPFDPVVWERARTERLFGFRYRISIYTPQAQREHGYYVLPALVDDALVGRIDLKSDRQAGVLRVQAAWAEPDAPPETAERLAPVIRAAAAWQGLPEMQVAGRGDLAPALAAALATSLR